MAKAGVSVCAAAGMELKAAFDGLDDRDRPRCCRYVRTAMGRLRRGTYNNATEFKRDAADALKPRAIDWDSLSEFIAKLVDTFKNLIPLFIK